MECKIDGCSRDAMYKERRLCQMHYFRFMRNGTYDTVMKRKYRRTNPAGYSVLYEENHPLATKCGYVYEHRLIVYKKYGESLPNCKLCDKELTWDICHVDHINEDVSDNKESNLRPLCMTCNVRRGRKPEYMYKGRHVLEFEGEKKTANEWGRDPRVLICNNTIIYRKRQGMSDYDALFSPRKTHNSKD